MTDVINQIGTLAGVIVGVAATYVATRLGDRRRLQQEQATKLNDTRRLAYANYAKAVKAYIVMASRIAAARELGAPEQPMEPEVGLRELARLENVRSTAWESVLLVGDARTVAAAREWHRRAWYLEWFARGQVQGREAYLKARAAVDEARDAFYECARTGLDVHEPLPYRPPTLDWLALESGTPPTGEDPAQVS